ncbi:MAG: carbohydrate-binding protein, partial [Cyclobacteriaceae bacterium]
KYWSHNEPNDLDWVLPLREEHNVPLWMGESGENSNTWFTDAVSLFENNNIGWAWWTMRKIGDIDSPYATDISPGYQKILDYWGGNGPKPTAEEAFEGMMQLSENLLVENSRFRKDVPDALMRQVKTDETVPYAKHIIPGIIHLSDFDLGKNEFAYYDKDVADYNLSTGSFQAWNSGWAYRNDGVDIQNSDDDINNNGYQIGFTSAGEWISYTVQIEESGQYKADLRYATDLPNGKFHLSIDDESITSLEGVSQTGGWSIFNTHSVENIILEAGKHVLKMHFDDGSINVTNIEFSASGTAEDLPFRALTAKTGQNEKSIELTMNRAILASSISAAQSNISVTVNGVDQTVTEVKAGNDQTRTIIVELETHILFSDIVKINYEGESIKATNNFILEKFRDLSVINRLAVRQIFPSRIQAEDFDAQVGFALEETTDFGEGFNLGYTDVNDYADYKIFVREAGNYTMNIRVAAQSNIGKVGFYTLDDAGNENELITINTPVTGGWQTWETVSDDFSIEAGIHTLRMKILNSGFNINWFSTAKIKEILMVEDHNRILIYPNPTNGLIHVTNSEYNRFELYSLSGSTLLSGPIADSKTIELINLDSGLYVFKAINTKTGKYSQSRIIIEN